MPIDCPLTCYICGETDEEEFTLDLIGCFVQQEEADEKFKEKFGEYPDSFLFVCDECFKRYPKESEKAENEFKVYDIGYSETNSSKNISIP